MMGDDNAYTLGSVGDQTELKNASQTYSHHNS